MSDTKWDIWTLDVWGNADDGFEVNDRRHIGSCTFDTAILDGAHNAAKEHVLDHVLGFAPFDITGFIVEFRDDSTIYIDQSRDGMPLFTLETQKGKDNE